MERVKGASDPWREIANLMPQDSGQIFLDVSRGATMESAIVSRYIKRKRGYGEGKRYKEIPTPVIDSLSTRDGRVELPNEYQALGELLASGCNVRDCASLLNLPEPRVSELKQELAKYLTEVRR